MEKWAEAKMALQGYFEQSTGLSFCWEERVRLIFPFGILEIVDSESLGSDFGLYESINESLSLHCHGLRRLSLEAHVFSKSIDPMVYLEKARLGFSYPQNHLALNAEGLYFLKNHTLQNLNALDSGCKRARLVVDFHYQVQRTHKEIAIGTYPTIRGDFQ